MSTDSSAPDAPDVAAGTSPEPSAGPIHPHDRAPGWLLELHRSLDRRVPEHTRHRLAQVVGFGAAIIGTLAALDVAKSLDPSISLLAWVGLFLANWIGNGGLLVPIPGLRFVGWTMVVHQGAEGPTLLIGLIAGIAMGLGQMSFYCTAAAGSERAQGSKKAPRSGRIVDSMRRARDRIARFVEFHGIPTIFGLSLVPNPLTTFASITAGSLGMGFRRFLPANFGGHIILGLILALFGRWLASV